MDAVLGVLESLLAAVIDAIDWLFNTLFFWLPDDPFAGYISDLQTSLAATGIGLRWLNWFVDINFLADGLVVVTGALLIYLGWAIFRELVQFIYELLPIG